MKVVCGLSTWAHKVLLSGEVDDVCKISINQESVDPKE